MSEKDLSVLIVDDEKLARKDLKFLLKSMPGVSVVGEAKNGVEALEQIGKLSPELILLDIEMPGLNGLQVVEKLLKKGFETSVVFITAYDHYAVRAFEVNAVDYLLKPVAAERLKETIRRVRKRLEDGGASSHNLEGLLSSMKSREVRKLSLRMEKSHRIVDEDELVYVVVEKGIVTAVTKDSHGTLPSESLDELQTLLSKDRFIRVHRSYVVNIDMIQEVIPWFSGTYRLKLKNGSVIPLSRNHVKDLRAILRF
ncbi:MAG: response regulator [Candidatus Latescibacteria bacterium]|nr:response regulator [Candidatus Latescibacterota bacterium]NIM64514.1 response regulator [Candidatus Latescibacterota bacterium]NIO00667.1 response regulator [Candidatus Latescibacterota bacterium]NIO27070.1 response regulator [Candidatus Latescibacterota bacterium]NIO54594.1 response regulator [Candidatus Latescibacterota bacterium]